MSATQGLRIWNGEAVDRARVPSLTEGDFKGTLVSAVQSGSRIAALMGVPDTAASADAGLRLLAVVVRRELGRLELLSTMVGKRFASLTPDLPQLHLFEREIYEEFGVVPDGHPWLKPVRRPLSYSVGEDERNELFSVDGEEVHEVAVGPVHAGIIEPGHFRFQCHGERVFHLEILLGYQHRGIEHAMLGGPGKRSMYLAETIAGDTSVGHATAHARVLEGLGGTEATARGQALRAVGLELERIANHTGDLGALAGDVGFLPTASFCGRIRGDFLQMTAGLCGSRFGRGLVRPGGVTFDLDTDGAERLTARLEQACHEVEGAVSLLWNSPSVRARFDEVGCVPTEMAHSLGLVGPVARASGLPRDVRRDLPTGAYRFAQMSAASWDSGDVFARAYIRWMEIERSLHFLRDLLRGLPSGASRRDVRAPRPNACTVACTEGWRGEIVHVALTDDQGRFDRYKVVDPSFHNWMGLAVALRGQQMSDFPVCNKSFNLSYCGHDL